MPRVVFINDIPGYVAPTQPGVKPRKLTKNHRYPPKLPPLLEGMTCPVDIIPALVKMKYEYHDLLLLKDVSEKTYQLLQMVPSTPIQQIPHPWAQGLERFGLLGLINMPHFRRANKANANVK